ncbi:transposase [Streptomyces sp. Lzd4kr]|nr:transposase [Streptomyces sp. Lzd4kr]
MQLRYNYRVYPDAAQRRALASAFGCARVVWNDCLRDRKEAHAAGLPYVTSAELSRLRITQAKRTQERAWLADVSAVVLQQSLRDLDTAYRNFFDSLGGKRQGRKVGPPRYKSKKDTRQSIRLNTNAFRLQSDGTVYVAKVGNTAFSAIVAAFLTPRLASQAVSLLSPIRRMPAGVWYPESRISGPPEPANSNDRSSSGKMLVSRALMRLMVLVRSADRPLRWDRINVSSLVTLGGVGTGTVWRRRQRANSAMTYESFKSDLPWPLKLFLNAANLEPVTYRGFWPWLARVSNSKAAGPSMRSRAQVTSSAPFMTSPNAARMSDSELITLRFHSGSPSASTTVIQ